MLWMARSWQAPDEEVAEDGLGGQAGQGKPADERELFGFLVVPEDVEPGLLEGINLSVDLFQLFPARSAEIPATGLLGDGLEGGSSMLTSTQSKM